MNSCTLLVQILSCESVKIIDSRNQVIKLKARLLKRKRLVTMHVTIWNKKTIGDFKLMKKLDYFIIEGKLHKNNTTLVNSTVRTHKTLVLSASRILKYQSVLKNKDIDLFIK
uniref:Hypothetical chloroplast protein 111 n=1 Tax=Pyropia perforata TaxID=182771 RepID=A0A023I8I3_PYRPE|nr:hypothetical chloroplast protein 111 [Neoporphyra perforata]AGV01091.1 hypothetical chloroplast protein 111 [Neoporphyra perforata]AHB35015.1 hypothetical chloroplast protein 111 [Neoporphyra perforata]AHB35224.1 hypothetical chloroplast protein 111 [Neoporphyra perforata]AIA19386.1 hypothetical protein [Neoporphyra perforata]AIA19595.1 hypothetical protein [Neoporphyra perforata]